jgi:hypothetical protein
LPFRVATQNDAGGNPGAIPGSLSIAKIRAYNRTLSAAQIAANYNAERAQFPLQPVITQVRVNPANGFIAFDWVPAAGQTYAVDRTTDLGNPAAWTEVATGQTSGSYTNNPGGAGEAYYRLRVE